MALYRNVADFYDFLENFKCNGIYIFYLKERAQKTTATSTDRCSICLFLINFICKNIFKTTFFL